MIQLKFRLLTIYFVECSLKQGSVVSTERDLIMRIVSLDLSNDFDEIRGFCIVFS